MDRDILYQKFLEDPKSVPSYELANISSKFKFDKTLSSDKKKELLPYFIPYFERFPDKFIQLIDSEEYYLDLIKNNSKNYFKLCFVDHPYKELEERLFYDYAPSYAINDEDLKIQYAKKSNIVLRNTLKKHMWESLINFFDKEAFDEETADYIIENDRWNLVLFNHQTKSILISYPSALKKLIEKDFLSLTELHDDYLSEEVCESINLTKEQSKKLYEYIKERNFYKPVNLYALLLKDYPDVLEIFKGEPTDYLIKCILKNNLHYNEKWPVSLLNDQRIIKDIILHSSIDCLFNNNILLDDNNLDLLIQSIEKHNYKVKVINNRYLLNNTKLINYLMNHYHINSNYFKVDNSKLISNVGRNLEKLRKVFSDNDLMIIKREIVDNNYFLDVETIINSISPNTFKYIYDSLYKMESRVSENSFSFFFFIKFCEYFANNSKLLKELEEHFDDIDEILLNNLSLALNHNSSITYHNLQNYESYYYQKVMHDDLDTKGKLLKYIFNANEQQAIFFRENITDLVRLTRLQLEFPKESYNYNFIDLYLSLVQLLDEILDGKIASCDNLPNFKLSSLYSLEVMRENILRLYGLYYYKKNLDEEKLASIGKVRILNGRKVLDITGEEFLFYMHSENFNSQYDFTYEDDNEREFKKKNYICTTVINELSFDILDNEKLIIYDMPNPNSLISFGNRDVAIYQTMAPLITVGSPYYTDADEACLISTNKLYAKNEFDFLRFDNHNKPFVSKYSHDNLYLDKEKHVEILNNKYLTLCERIESLTYHDLNKLIVMSKVFGIDEETLDRLRKRVSKLTEKEQMVLLDALSKYAFVRPKEGNKKF